MNENAKFAADYDVTRAVERDLRTWIIFSDGCRAFNMISLISSGIYIPLKKVQLMRKVLDSRFITPLNYLRKSCQISKVHYQVLNEQKKNRYLTNGAPLI